jgi:hypothetical protein
MVRNLGQAWALAASIFVPMGLLINAAQGDEVFAPVVALSLPPGPTGCNSAPCNPLQSFDISYVDEKTHTYLLADRSNASIDVFNTNTLTNSFVTRLIPTLPFAGVVASPANLSGPNGVILITGTLAKRSPTCTVACGPTFGNGQPVSLVWATDSPTPASSGTSSIKVMDLASGATVKVINTLGVRRSDELCFVTLPSGAPDPKNPYVLVANDDPLDNFVSIWRWDNFASAGRISLAGHDPNAKIYNTAAGGANNAANGIEQCKFNPRNGHFYLSVPATQLTPITSFGTLTGGSSYTTATYNGVPLTGGTGTGATANITVAGGKVTAVTLVNPGSAYTVGDSLSASASNIGGTGSGFSILVATVGPTASTTDGFVLEISLPVMTQSQTVPSTNAKVVAAHEIFSSTGCVGPAGLSIGPSFNGSNTNGEIALGCGATGGSSLIINDSGNPLLSVPLPAGTDETWYDPATNHFFFAQSGTGPASGWLGVVDANEYPPRSYVQEDGDATGGSPVQDTTVPAATGSHSVAVFPGICTNPTRLSRVYVPTRSTLTTPNNSSTICSANISTTFTPTGSATTWDQWGCIAVFSAPATCSSTGHNNPSP